VILICLPASAQQAPATSDQRSEKGSAPSTSLPDLTPDKDGKLSPQQMQQLARVVVEKHFANRRLQRNYTYIDREVQNNLDGSGNIKSTEIKTYEILEIYGEQVLRLIEKDDKPLSAKEAAKEEERIQKIIDERKNESEDDRRRREEKERKRSEEGQEFLRDAADAYNFTFVDSEMIDGRDAWVIDCEPRPGFEPRLKDAKVLSKLRGRVWIDKADLQLAKLNLEVIDTASFGWIIARFHKGTRILVEQTRVNDEVWLPRHTEFKLDLRVALFKGYNFTGEDTFRDYKKFSASSKIVGIGEVQADK
jgi:hypothetical protein